MACLAPTRDWVFAVPSLSITLAVRSWQPAAGALSGEPLIALHGWMDNAGTFEALLPHVESSAPCHALDFSGHGLSSHRPAGSDYPIWTYVEEVLALQETLGLKRSRLIGHSMGGAVAALFAALYPERVSSVVLLDAGGPLSTADEKVASQMRRALDEKQRIRQRSMRYYASREAAVTSRARRGLGRAAARLLGERGIAHCDKGYYWTVDRQLQRPSPLSFTEGQVRALMGRIEAPVLLVAASETLSDVPWFAGKRLEAISRLTRQTLDGNHFQHLEGRVQEVAQCINSFLADPASGGR